MRRAACTLAVATTALAGCGGDESNRGASTPRAKETPPTSTPRPPRLAPARCPAGTANCSTATGRVVYVEVVDPDGDGDAHFVLLGRDSITAPGVSAIDVERDLRPHPLPQRGDLVTAAGPVYRGSHGQRQIEATEFRVRRRR